MAEPKVAHDQVAPCESFRDHSDPGEGCTREYRILFPFEEDPLTEGLWWEVDRENACWRTVGWGIDDPQLHEGRCPKDMKTKKPQQSAREEEDGNPSAQDASPQDLNNSEDELLSAFQDLDLRANAETWPEKVLFDGFCAANDVDGARNLLQTSKEPQNLVEKRLDQHDIYVLHMVCAKGHLEVVELLVEYRAPLEQSDEGGYTPLFTALEYGFGRIAHRLIEAGASFSGLNPHRESVLFAATRALVSPVQAIERRPAPSNSAVVRSLDSESRVNTEAGEIRVGKREEEIKALREIIQLYNNQYSTQQAQRKRQKLVERHGEEQARRFLATNIFDQAELVGSILRQMMTTPLSTRFKTIACLTRGTYLPYTFAISGWSHGDFGDRDRTLDRRIWFERVFKLAEIVGHDLPTDEYDPEDRPGSYAACHAEKQVLAFLVWNHTATMMTAKEENILGQLREKGPPSLSKLRSSIFVGQTQQNKAEVCLDCLEFCEKVVERFGIRLRLWGVRENEEPWKIESWGTW